MHATRTRRAGSVHTLVGLKSHRSGEGLGVQWGLGRLGAAIHWGLSKLCGLGRWSRNLFRYQMRGFTCFWGAHSFTRCRTSYPTLPHFPVFRKLIPPSDIFEVKIWKISLLFPQWDFTPVLSHLVQLASSPPLLCLVQNTQSRKNR